MVAADILSKTAPTSHHEMILAYRLESNKLYAFLQSKTFNITWKIKLNNILLGKNCACKNFTYHVSVTFTTEIQCFSRDSQKKKQSKTVLLILIDEDTPQARGPRLLWNTANRCCTNTFDFWSAAYSQILQKTINLKFSSVITICKLISQGLCLEPKANSRQCERNSETCWASSYNKHLSNFTFAEIFWQKRNKNMNHPAACRSF